MKPAVTSKRLLEKTKLAIWREDSAVVEHSDVAHLADLFERGDLLVVNRSGTMPSSFHGHLARTDEPLEIRLATFLGRDDRDFKMWRAVAFGPGDWRQRTEDRLAPPRLQNGDEIRISQNLVAIVKHVRDDFNRLIDVEFSSENLARSLFEAGRPIQYSYLMEPLEVWDQQTIFAGPPISVEPPSAAFPLTWATIFDLQKRGIQVATILHGAGLSSTGDSSLDLQFPLDEYFEVPPETRDKVIETHKRGKRVFALGTTVARALETASQNNGAWITAGRTTLRLSSDSPLRVTDALITGMHEAETSHFELMKAFTSRNSKEAIHRLVEKTSSYRSHEYGDLTALVRKTRP